MTEVTDSDKKSDKSVKTEKVTDKKDKATKAEKVNSGKSIEGDKSTQKRGRKKTIKNEELLEQLQKQLTENQLDLIQIVKDETRNALEVELRRADRRRRWNNFWRDMIIIILALGCGYLGYLLYDINYSGTQQNNDTAEESTSTAAGPIKDEEWYLANYSYLLDRTRTNLNADNVSAYYLYSGDLAVNNMKSEYLLNIAFQNLVDNGIVQIPDTYEQKTDEPILVLASDLQSTFVNLFGKDARFKTNDFISGCLNFVYQKASDTFEAKNQSCQLNQHREIVEKIEKIYEEGEVIYIITNAGVYDKDEKSFYSFNDLFEPVVEGVSKQEFEDHTKGLNRYQYQFKKSGDDYQFSKIVKLR